MTSHEAGDGAIERRSRHRQSGGRRAAANPTPRASRAQRAAAARAARIEAALAKRTDPGKRHGVLRVVGTVFLVPALVGTVALPAYAFIPGLGGDQTSALFDLTEAGAQHVDVSGLATGAPASDAGDGYSVVTAEDIERKKKEDEAEKARQWAAEVASRAGTGSYAQIGVQAEGDDYPYWNTVPDEGISPLGYYYRECVDFVAWRLNRDRGTTGPFWFTNGMSHTGSAYSWADAWVANGWPTSNEPVVGAVAWFTYNHVAYVQSIPGDGTVIIEEYNQNGDHSYHRRAIPAGSALYLYPPG